MSNLIGGKVNRIFDVWLYNNEADIAYIRLWRLYHYVDQFIILYSDFTFTQVEKSLSFYPYEKEIEKYKDKIRLVKTPNVCVQEFLFEFGPWCLEKTQRTYGYTYLKNNFDLTEDDIIILSDSDEVPITEALVEIRKYPPKTYYHLKGSTYFPFYYHYLSEWNNVAVFRYDPSYTLIDIQSFRNVSPSDIVDFPMKKGKSFVTHCSYCFSSIEQYRNKLTSFSHQEYNTEPYITSNWIFKSHYCRIKIGDFDSPYIEENHSDWRSIVPDDRRLDFLHDPSFEYDINQTTYTREDLKTLCGDEDFLRTSYTLL